MSKGQIWCVIAAAGAGRRMGAERPKQYLPLAGRMVIEHTLERLCGHPKVAGVTVAVAQDDPWWESVRFPGVTAPRRCQGGGERYQSVLNALGSLSEHGTEQDDWVLVHDAVRPCVRREDIDRLVSQGGAHPVGGVLGVPVRDTMKRVDPENNVEETVSRDGLWHALTPQMFRLGALTKALERAQKEGVTVSDEAQAMERTGALPCIVEGHYDNLKITISADLALAELYLQAQGRGE